MGLRACIFCAWILALELSAGASSALLKAPAPDAPQPVAVMTYAGKADLKITPLQPSPAVTFALLMDSLTAAQLASFKKEILAAYTPARGAKLHLALLQNGSLVKAGPFPTRLRFKNALDEIRLAAAQSSPPSGGAMVESMFGSAAQFGGEWSSVIFVGEWPAVDPGSADYAVALLLREFSTQHLRVSWVAPSGNAPSEKWMPLTQASGGRVLGSTGRELAAMFDPPGAFLQLDWTALPPSAGFICAHSTITDAAGAALLDVPDIAAPDAAILPTMELYSQLRTKASEAAALARQEPLAPESAQQLRDALKAAMGVNPRDAETLLAAATFYEKFKDYESAVRFRTWLAEVQPLDGGAQAALGHALFLSADLDKAEAALTRATALNIKAPQMAEDLARIRIARKDDLGALPYLEEVLHADARRQDIWFLQAQAGARMGNTALAIKSFEQGLDLGGVHVEETKSLLALYIKDGQKPKAEDLSKAVLAKLPAEVEVRSQFAAALEDSNLNSQALAAWRRVLEVRPEEPLAHQHIARLLLVAGDFSGSAQAADIGLGFAPKSAALYLVKAEALENLGRYYQTRQTLQQGVEEAAGPEILRRWAEVEETFGRAPAAYQQLADWPQLPEGDRVLALQRGLQLAIRDGDLKHARTFVAGLKASGHPEAAEWMGSGGNAGDSVMVFGGLSALGFAARAKEQAPAERFFVEYSRALMEHTGIMYDEKEARAYQESVDRYLQRLGSLESQGKRKADGVTISLSLQTKDARSRTETVLGLLGFKLRNGKKGPELDLGEGKVQIKSQETLSALAIDQVGMQEAFQAGKSFELEIPYERAVIYPSEKLWRDAFPDKGSGGFAGVLLRDPKLARVYLGVSYLDRDTVQQLLAAVDLRTLHDRYAELLAAFAPAFAVQGGHAVCPGGAPAEPHWEKLVGASVKQPGNFFRALLERDDGKLLAYFYTLSHLDSARQAFFTANAARTEQYYRLFVVFKNRQPGSLTAMRDDSFPDFLRSVPIDAQRHVDFPGSPAVWMVAKGNAAVENRISKLSKASERWVGTEVEDEVLVRLAQTRYHDKAIRHTELDNFLAVAHIAAHRANPLDDESALMLAQHYLDASESYAYFTDLTALSAADFRQFFSVLEHLRAQPPQDANLRMGQMHALTEWLCLLRQRQAISDDEAALLFSKMLERFAAASSAASYAAASLDTVQAILGACKLPQPSKSKDQHIRACLTGGLASRDLDFARVLDLQKVPSLDALFTLYEAAKQLVERHLDTAEVAKALAGLPAADLAPKVKVSNKEKDQIQRYSPAGLHQLASKVTPASSNSKSAAREAEKFRRELLQELEPQVALALSGVVYAYFLRPADLVIAEDPLLLRKHRYFDFGSVGQNNPANMAGEFRASGEGSGSFFVGGFAEFALVSGVAAGAGWKTGGPSGRDTVAAQISAIRTTPWDLLTEPDLRLLGLRVAVAREWIVNSATNAKAEEALRDASIGVLSLLRRADMLNGIRARNWARVWEAVTVPDLFALGSRYLDNFKTDAWSSAATAALRKLAANNDGARLRWLGSVPYRSSGCSHAHWMTLPPYEEYEHRFFGVENAERWAEFKIYLALQADEAGTDAATLSRAAEPLAAKAFRAAQMTDFHDWRSVLTGYSSITSNDLKRAAQP